VSEVYLETWGGMALSSGMEGVSRDWSASKSFHLKYGWQLTQTTVTALARNELPDYHQDLSSCAALCSFSLTSLFTGLARARKAKRGRGRLSFCTKVINLQFRTYTLERPIPLNRTSHTLIGVKHESIQIHRLSVVDYELQQDHDVASESRQQEP
jgi:hypothetical protein